jgi:hypothetical protein
MVGPPLLAGAVHETLAEPLPAVAETPVGAPGMLPGTTGSDGDNPVAGMTAADGDDVALLPAALVATTVKVYAVPLVRPLTTQGLVVHDAVAPPGDAVTVYPVIVPPPLFVGAVHETLAELLCAAAETPVGAPGTVAGVTELDGDDTALLPTELVAPTVKV